MILSPCIFGDGTRTPSDRRFERNSGILSDRAARSRRRDPRRVRGGNRRALWKNTTSFVSIGARTEEAAVDEIRSRGRSSGLRVVYRFRDRFNGSSSFFFLLPHELCCVGSKNIRIVALNRVELPPSYTRRVIAFFRSFGVELRAYSSTLKWVSHPPRRPSTSRPRRVGIS